MSSVSLMPVAHVFFSVLTGRPRVYGKSRSSKFPARVAQDITRWDKGKGYTRLWVVDKLLLLERKVQVWTFPLDRGALDLDHLAGSVMQDGYDFHQVCDVGVRLLQQCLGGPGVHTFLHVNHAFAETDQ